MQSEQNLLGLWKWHQRRLSSQLSEGALLLDCHSFPEELSDVDICIGFNEDWSKPSKATIEMAVNHFMYCGYKVGVYTPYGNSETPACPFHYHSMMLEINKRAYLQPGSIHLRSNTLRDDINGLMERLLA